jgi:disulfide bond formation protein DsbB
VRSIEVLPSTTGQTDPAALAALAVAVIGAATLLGAWFFEYVLAYMPCPLCLDERIPYYVDVPLGVALFFAARAQAPRAWLAVGLAVIAASMLWNAGLSVYHSGVEWHLWAGPPDCSGSLNSLGSAGGLLNQLQNIHIPRCDAAAWRLFGISLAGYNALISLALAGIALWGIFWAMRRAPALAGVGSATEGAR